MLRVVYITVRLGSGKTMVSILHMDLISCRYIVYYVTLLFENAIEHDRESLIYERFPGACGEVY